MHDAPTARTAARLMTDGDLNATSGKWELEAVCVWRGAEHEHHSSLSCLAISTVRGQLALH